MSPGWSLDLTTFDEQGRPWDFSRADCKQRARDLVRAKRPILLVGSAMYTYLSSLMGWMTRRMDPQVVRQRVREAVEHLKFLFELYEIQASSGRYYLHEHPTGASSWRQPAVVDFIARQETCYSVHSNMCSFGMTSVGPSW